MHNESAKAMQENSVPSSQLLHEDKVCITRDGPVAIVMMSQPPNNYLTEPTLMALADALEALDKDEEIRVAILGSEGKNFCAGANFNQLTKSSSINPAPLYAEALRVFAFKKPMIAAIQGAAIGAGVGLALAADFRISCAEARFSVNFNRLGFHPGFGLSYTLPRLIGPQQAALLFYTARRIGGQAALNIGLVDELVDQSKVLEHAKILANDIAGNAPLAVQSTRQTLRSGMQHAVSVAIELELAQQSIHFQTEDFVEGVSSVAERRDPKFLGR